MDSVHGSWTSAGVAGPRVHRGLPPVADGKGSPELGLAAALGHGGSPRGWKMELTVGAHLAVTEGEGVVAGLRKLEEETSFGKYANAAQAGMGRARARGLREKRGRGQWLAGLRGRAGRLAAEPIGPNAKENSF